MPALHELTITVSYGNDTVNAVYRQRDTTVRNLPEDTVYEHCTLGVARQDVVFLGTRGRACFQQSDNVVDALIEPGKVLANVTRE